MFMIQAGRQNSLSARTPVSPYIPISGESLVFAQGADVRARDALIVTIVPFADILSDLHAGLAVESCRLGLYTPLFPRQRILDSEVEELEGPLGSLSRRYVSVLWVGDLD